MYLRSKLFQEAFPNTVVPLEPYTLEHLIKWLESKDPNEIYDWYCFRSCLFAQYAIHCGYIATEHRRQYPLDNAPYKAAFTNFALRYGDEKTDEIISYIGYGTRRENKITKVGLPTFGEALKRAHNELAWSDTRMG